MSHRFRNGSWSEPERISRESSSESNHQITSPSTQDVTLSIDIGMTSSRMVLVKNGADPWKGGASIGITRFPDDLAPPEFKDGEFPNLATPLLIDQDVDKCLPHIARGNTIAVPVKTLFYYRYLVRYHHTVQESKSLDARRDADIRIGAIQREIPQLRQLWSVYTAQTPQLQRKIDRHFEKIFIAYLMALARRCGDVTEKQDFIITKLVATVPPNWDTAMEREYVGYLELVWRDAEITIITEIDAVAHWLSYRRLNFWFTKTVHEVAALDFGGHTLSFYQFDLLANRTTRRFSFYRSGKYRCYHGGSDYYAASLREHLRTLITQRFNHLSDAEQANMLEDGMKHYQVNHRATITGDPYAIQASKDPVTSTQVFLIAEEFSRRFYDDAFDRPRRMVKKLLRGLAPGSVVMMVGGTFLNIGVLNRYKQMIEQAGMVCRTATDLEILPDERPYIVARGAAFAALGEEPLATFIEKSSFAINVPDAELRIPIIMERGVGVERTVNVPEPMNGQDFVRVEISGRPQQISEESATEVERAMTYSLRSMAMLPGDYQYRLDFTADADFPSRGILDFRAVPIRLRGRGRRPDPYVRRWPIYFDIGQRVAKIDIDLLEPPEKPEPYPEPSQRVNRGFVQTLLQQIWSGEWASRLRGVRREVESPGYHRRISRSNTEQFEQAGVARRGFELSDDQISDADLSDEEELGVDEHLTPHQPTRTTALGTPGSALHRTPIRPRYRPR